MEMKESYIEEFNKKIHFWGRLTLAMGIAASLIYGFYLSYIKGYHPGWDVIGTALISIAAIIGHTWVNLPALLTDVLIMGPAGTYMASLTGNLANMRMPSAMAAQSAVNAEQGSKKGEIISIFGIAASILINTSFLILIVLIGTTVIEKMPDTLKSSLNYIVPSLFGAIFGQFAFSNMVGAIIAIGIAFIVIAFLNIPGYIKTPLVIFSTIALNYIIYKTKNSNKQSDRETNN